MDDAPEIHRVRLHLRFSRQPKRLHEAHVDSCNTRVGWQHSEAVVCPQKLAHAIRVEHPGCGRAYEIAVPGKQRAGICDRQQCRQGEANACPGRPSAQRQKNYAYQQCIGGNPDKPSTRAKTIECVCCRVDMEDFGMEKIYFVRKSQKCQHTTSEQQPDMRRDGAPHQAWSRKCHCQ